MCSNPSKEEEGDVCSSHTVSLERHTSHSCSSVNLEATRKSRGISVSCVGTNGWVNLQVLPNPVFEGDTLTLQCQVKGITARSQVKFYKNRKFLNFSKINQPLSIEAATVQSSGYYYCTREVEFHTYRHPQTSAVIKVQVQELFQPPVLSTNPSAEPREGDLLTLRCQTKLHPKKSTLRLLFSFYKDGHTVQNTSRHTEFCIPGVTKGDSGVYQCKVALEGGQVQKQSPSLEIRVQAPVSRPLLTLRHRARGPAVGDVIELLCEAQRGSPPILYLFYLDGEILGNHSVLHGGAACLLFPVKSEQDAGNYSCEARNSVSREKSQPKKLSLDGSQALSTRPSSNWLVAGLLGGLLGVVIIAAALLAYCRPWRKAGPAPAQDQLSAPSGEQCPLDGNVYPQEEKEEDIIYSVVQPMPKRNKVRPAEFTSKEKDVSVVYAEVRCPQSARFPPRT
ncbi:PREDICTED: Fc receptor-like protein 6 [Chinchilla lanigera]|uniref:Fc receptor-like protein 6 n=1 Tax=Chinchilla lanigera TaxID=34839 RepID=UPI000696DE3B|nr:PREDICTED: Fc receptor-like protein 6 [Chinchilla lanigera]